MKRAFVMTAGVPLADTVQPGQLWKSSLYLVLIIERLPKKGSRPGEGHDWAWWRAKIVACYGDCRDAVGTDGQWGFPRRWERVS